VDYSQYGVAAGPDIEAGEETIPGLLTGLGPQAVAVITGLQWGQLPVTARAAPVPPAGIDPGWDVVAETDLECPEGTISVCDWAGPGHDELGELALTGSGRYRLRVHARNRKQVSQQQSNEEHHLLIWPAPHPAPPRLLTHMDVYGRVFSGEQRPQEPALDSLDLAAAAAVKRLAALVAQPDPPQLSGDLRVVHAETIAPATPRRVWNQIANPWRWVGLGGGTDPANFEIYLHDEPGLKAVGRFTVDQPFTHLAFTWSWASTETAGTAVAEPYMGEIDQITDETRSLTGAVRSAKVVSSSTLPPEPTTVDIHLHRHGPGSNNSGT
jgi:hypothetical protein